MRCGPQRRQYRSFTMRRSNRVGVRVGIRRGRDDRSAIGKPARYRAAHFAAVAGEHWNRSAARRTGHRCSTTSSARRRRPSGVSGALA